MEIQQQEMSENSVRRLTERKRHDSQTQMCWKVDGR
jgi:hypothetical protein